MRKINKKASLLILGVIMAIGLTGCGNNELKEISEINDVKETPESQKVNDGETEIEEFNQTEEEIENKVDKDEPIGLDSKEEKTEMEKLTKPIERDDNGDIIENDTPVSSEDVEPSVE